MKKLLLILLCLPLLFNSCEEDNSKYVGLWKIKGSHYWYLAADGSACNDVHYGHYGFSIIKDLQNCSCDDPQNLGNWMKINNQRFLQLTFQGESFNARILNETSDLLELVIMEGQPSIKLKRYSESDIKRRYEEKKKKREEYLKKEKERIIDEEKKQEEAETYVEYEEIELTEEESSYYGVINDPDGYTNVREEKSSKSEIVFKVYEGNEFEIIDDSDDNWWMIEYNGKQGYIYRNKIDIFKKHN